MRVVIQTIYIPFFRPFWPPPSPPGRLLCNLCLHYLTVMYTFLTIKKYQQNQFIIVLFNDFWATTRGSEWFCNLYQFLFFINFLCKIWRWVFLPFRPKFYKTPPPCIPITPSPPGMYTFSFSPLGGTPSPSFGWPPRVGIYIFFYSKSVVGCIPKWIDNSCFRYKLFLCFKYRIFYCFG